MRNIEKWRPSLVEKTTDGKMRPIKRNIYRGSWTIASRQAEVYPRLLQYAHGRLLDCGCGDMPYFEFYKNQVNEIIGVDRRNDLLHADMVCDLGEKIPFTDQTFDSVVLTDVIGHVPDAHLLFSECVRILKQQGILILSSPYMYWQTTSPYIFQYPGEPLYKKWCNELQLEIVEFDSYGGYLDVRLDLMNKALNGPIGARFTDVIRRILKSSGILAANRERTKYYYPLGYVLVARKK